MPKIDVELRAKTDEFEKDLAKVKAGVEVTPEVPTSAIDLANKKLKNLMSVTVPVKMDITELQEGADIAMQALELLKQPFDVRMNEIDTTHVAVLQEALAQLKIEASELERALQSVKTGSFEGSFQEARQLQKEYHSVIWTIEEMGETLERYGRMEVDTESLKDAKRELQEVGAAAEETGKKAEDAGRKGAGAFLGMNISLKRLAMSMIGMQSFYTLLNQASRGYMNSNIAAKASIMGVSNALGQMMAPAINVAIRALQNLVRWIMIALAYFKTFMNVIFGTNMQIQYSLKATTNATKGFGGMGKAAGKAGKKMKKAFKGILAPFDELNVITSEVGDNLDDMGGADMGGGGMGGIGDIAPDMSPYDISEYIAPMQRFAEWLEKHKTLIQAILVFIGTIVAIWAAKKIIGGVIELWGTVDKFFNLATSNPWLLLIGAIIAIIFVLWKNWDEISAWISNAWDKVWGGAKDLFARFGNWLSEKWDGIKTIWGNLMEFLGNVWSAAWSGIKTFFRGVFDFIVESIKFIGSIFSFVAKGLFQIWKVPWILIRDLTKLVWGIITGLWEAGKNTWKVIVEFIGNIWSKTWDGIKNFAGNVFNWFGDKGQWLVRMFSNVGKAVGEAFGKGWQFVKDTFANVWNWILGQLSKGGSIFKGFAEGVARVFKSIVNVMIRGINHVISLPFKGLNGMLNRLSGISILGARPFGFIGHNPVPVPHIPQFKKGYVGTSEQLGIFGEYAGAQHNPEIVTPENLMRDVVTDSLEDAGGVDSGGDLYITLHNNNEPPVTKVIKDYNDYKRKGGKLTLKMG